MKASGGDGILVELFQILKDDAVKVLHWICQQIWKTQQWPRDWKRSAFIPIPKKGNAKKCSNYRTIALISHASKVMFKILQARLQQYVNCEFLNVQAVLQNAEEPEIKLPTSTGSLKKQESSRKNIYFCFIDYTKAFVCIRKTGKLLKRWEYQTIWPASWEICMQVKKQQVELDMEQQTGSNSGKDYIKAIYCHPAYLTYMHCTSWEKLSWMKHKLESRLWGEISIISDMQMTPPLWQKAKKN